MNLEPRDNAVSLRGRALASKLYTVEHEEELSSVPGGPPA